MTADGERLRATATHTIRLDAPVRIAQRFFTPAGEERWVDGWRPTYVFPPDGRTEPGMVFTTGDGDEFTLWTLCDFDTGRHYARYARVTPASRSTVVEVQCSAVDAATTDVRVTYTATVLAPAHRHVLEALDAEPFRLMIEGWQAAIARRLPGLLEAEIR